jgi:hypothetical protein
VAAVQLFMRCTGATLFITDSLAQGIHDLTLALSR